MLTRIRDIQAERLLLGKIAQKMGLLSLYGVGIIEARMDLGGKYGFIY